MVKIFIKQLKNIIDFDPKDVFVNTHPYYYFQGDNVIGKLPYNDAGTLRLTYYARTCII